MSSSVDQILSGKYPAKAHAENVANYLRSQDSSIKEGLIYLESQKAVLHEDCDQEVEFRQRRPFFYLSGCNLPDSYLTYNLANKHLTLYIPDLDPAEVIWCGLPLVPSEALAQFDVDTVRTVSELAPDLSALTSTPLYTLPQFAPAATFSTTNTTALLPAVHEARVIKTPYEVALIEKANQTTAAAHHACMAGVKSASTESELYGLFLQQCVARGSFKEAYTGIFGAGRSAATLHYTKNNQPLAGKLNLLLDAGAELDNYASDVTRTFPINGKFTKESREIYDIVLEMQDQSIAALKPGENWDDIHLLAHKVAIEGLLKIGILKGGSVEEILAARTSTAFLPHGLGHYLGMDTHDAGGHPKKDEKDAMFRYLRKRGTIPVGCVVTVEPGLYFCDFIIKPYLEDPKHSKYIDAEVLEKYWDVGGVRIEDNLLITETGYRNLTSTVKTVEEMEKIINHL